jgi:hypothetical protein
MLKVFFGHHKCATSWVNRILKEACRQAGWRWQNHYNDRAFGGDPEGFVRDEQLDFLSCSNARPEHATSLGELRGFHVIRDPRDLLVSAYFSHLHSHPIGDWKELGPHRERLKSLSKEDGLLAELDFRAQELSDLQAWDYGRDNILELRMRDLTSSPYRGFVQIFRFLDLIDDEPFSARAQAEFLARYVTNRVRVRTKIPLGSPVRVERLPAEKLLGIVFDNRFEKLSGGRKKGEGDAKSHFRKGVAGDWRNHFTPKLERIFKERYGELLVKLGYESDLDWTAEDAA